MDKNIFIPKRKNYIELGELFFWTASINEWHPLLQEDEFKKIIIDSLDYLTNKVKIDVFAFVVMPTHIHLIWRTKELNGKETPQASFLKYTAHEFKKHLLIKGSNELSKYAVNASNKNYEFWQRDSVAVHLFTEQVAYQKLDYIHFNPCSKKWMLVNDPTEYVYSSAKYYMLDEKEYSFLKI